MSNTFEINGDPVSLWMSIDRADIVIDLYSTVPDTNGIILDIRMAKALSAALTSFISKLEQEAGQLGEHTELP